MPDPFILTTLCTKQAEIEKHIDSLNASLSQARADLFHVAACIRMFDPQGGEPSSVTAYAGTSKAMKRTELLYLPTGLREVTGVGWSGSRFGEGLRGVMKADSVSA